MSGSLTINPYVTTQPQNSFVLQTQGFFQGAASDDPSARLWLQGGYLASTETIVMWGGVPIAEQINNAGIQGDGVGPALKRSTSQATVTGWSVYNQAGSMLIGPGLTAPISGTGNYVAFFRNASNQRIPVQADPALITALAAANGTITSQALYWDVTNYRVTLTTTGGNFALPAATRLITTQTNSRVISYNTGTGAVTWTAGSVAVLLI